MPASIVGWHAASAIKNRRAEVHPRRRSCPDRSAWRLFSGACVAVLRLAGRRWQRESASLACLLWLAGNGCGWGAPIVDWLGFSAETSRTHFSLLDDQGFAFAQAEIVLTSGILGPASPSAGVLQAVFWKTPHGLEDSVLHTETVATSKVQVAPAAGSVQYQLVITGTDLSGMLFGVGQLFGSATAGTRRINLTALTGANITVPILFVTSRAWDDGIRFYTQPLTWDAGAQALLLDAGRNGESEFAFLSVPANGTPVTKVTFEMQNGYNAGAGDALEFAFGKPVPEPSLAGLFALGGLTLFLRNRPLHRGRNSNLRGNDR